MQSQTSAPSLNLSSCPPLLSEEVRTLAGSFSRSGVGLHSGMTMTVTVKPAEPEEGRYFVRVDRPGAPVIPAHVNAVSQTLLSTELSAGNEAVRTVEHLLGALMGMGIDNARIEIDGPEVPLLDGAALDWVRAIAQTGYVTQAAPPKLLADLKDPIWITEGDAFVAALPAPHLKLTYGIEFDLAAIGTQWFSWNPLQESFERAIAPARTFGLAHQIEALRQQGLIKGGSLDNALVCSEDGWVNPPLRFSNEPVRHKLLDLVGDLSLSGVLPRAHVLAYKANHRLHVQLSNVLWDVLSENGSELLDTQTPEGVFR